MATNQVGKPTQTSNAKTKRSRNVVTRLLQLQSLGIPEADFGRKKRKTARTSEKGKADSDTSQPQSSRSQRNTRQVRRSQKREASSMDDSGNNVTESDSTLDMPKDMQVPRLLFYTCAWIAITCLPHSPSLDCSTETVIS